MCRDNCLNLIAYSTLISMLPKITCRPSTSNTNLCQVDRTSCRCLITIEDLARAERRVNVLMGDKVEPRRKWIEDNVKFTLEEATVF